MLNSLKKKDFLLKKNLFFNPHFSSEFCIQCIRFGVRLLNNHKIKTLFKQRDLVLSTQKESLYRPKLIFSAYNTLLHFTTISSYPTLFYCLLLLFCIFSLSIIAIKIINKQFLLLLYC